MRKGKLVRAVIEVDMTDPKRPQFIITDGDGGSKEWTQLPEGSDLLLTIDTLLHVLKHWLKRELSPFVVTLRSPEEVTPNALHNAIKELGEHKLPVSYHASRDLASVVGWAQLSFDEHTNDVRAEIEFVQNDRGKALPALIRAGGELGFAIAGKVIERDGPVIKKMEIDGVDFVGVTNAARPHPWDKE